ncbi:STAS-like domain-containing protein [Methanosarcina hadiensis]|uniref:STAS-like domain-containing protein n=1 Tax=Methanosarcina hadiensis TaxID=3078083 RepID=UPI0039776884
MGKSEEEKVKIKIIETAGINCCVAACDGQKVHDRITVAFQKNSKVELSFAETNELTPAFLNAAVGQLYGTFHADLIEKNLSFIDLDPEDEIVLKRVMERAKGYFEHAYSCRKALRDVIGGEDA